jgi:hypothetical protein
VLLKNNKVVNTIARGVKNTLHSYAWHVKAVGAGRASGGTYRIKMLQGGTSHLLAISGNFSIKSPSAVAQFKIITPPAGSTARWCAGRNYLIKWKTINPTSGTYSIDLFSELTGEVVIPIAASEPQTGQVSFTVPVVNNVTSSVYKLRFKNSFWNWKNVAISYNKTPFTLNALYGAHIGNQMTVTMRQTCPVSAPI